MKPFTFLFFSAATLLCYASAFKVVLLPTPFVSHMNYFEPLALELHQSGHETYLVLSDSFRARQRLTDKGLNILTYDSKGTCEIDTDDFFKRVTIGMIDNGGDPGVLGKLVAPAIESECSKFLLDIELLEKGKKIGFDLAVVDGLFFARCLYIWPKELNIPYITLTTLQDFWRARVPAPPSFVPFHYSSFGERMTYLERFANVFMSVFFALSTTSPPLSQVIRDRYKDSSADFESLATKSKLWMFNTDFSIDYAKPSLPNIIHVGGMSLNSTKPLPELFAKFVAKSNRIVVVTFGSVISQLPNYIVEKMIDAFRQSPFQFVWRLPKAKEFSIPDNVLAVDWIPQNDLLGHEKTVAFVTHSGNNGQFEALYHAVPMVALPIFADQIYNSLRMEAKNYGVRLSMHKFTSQQLKEALEKVADNKEIKANLVKGSMILRDRPLNARKRAVYWIEHVIKYGDRHLRSYGIDMPWYQYLLLDVAVGYALLFGFLIYLIKRAFVYVSANAQNWIGTSKNKKKTH
ncbi:DgyrCDS14243 [Dimorphilus gyrociliatus]|uniref:UDP-glucuronosyltransferase n=1 Tax=Dimorphilus gyrociliatus TaxID=2664684 RepID=A0A7I8WD37_9ANNE|nr:DgyrCDS14243 [Dimorphilus gyrociliatus]